MQQICAFRSSWEFVSKERQGLPCVMHQFIQFWVNQNEQCMPSQPDLGKGVVWLHVTNKSQLAVTKEQATLISIKGEEPVQKFSGIATYKSSGTS